MHKLRARDVRERVNLNRISLNKILVLFIPSIIFKTAFAYFYYLFFIRVLIVKENVLFLFIYPSISSVVGRNLPKSRARDKRKRVNL